MDIEERSILPNLTDPNFNVGEVKHISVSLGVPLFILWAVVVPSLLAIFLKVSTTKQNKNKTKQNKTKQKKKN